MKKVRIAQIGVSLDSHGVQIFKSLAKQSDLFEIAGYVFPENEAERYKDHDLSCFTAYPQLTIDEVLNDPTITAVTVETEEIYTTKYALLAAQHGKHIHMEKPGSPDLSSFEALIRAVKHQKTVFHLGYMYRYNPFVSALLSDIKAGKLGEIYTVEAAMSCWQPEKRYETLKGLPGGMMYFLGCHLVDLMLQIKGSPEEVLPYNSSSGRCGEITDLGLALFRYPSGVSTIRTSAVEKGGYIDRHLTVTGSEKAVVLRPLELARGDGLITGKTVYESPKWNEPGIYEESDVYDRYDAMMAAFAAMVRGEKENPYTYDYELELFQTVLRCCNLI